MAQRTEDSIIEEVLRSAGENARTVQALEEGMGKLREAVAAQEAGVAEIRERIVRGVAELGALAQDAGRTVASMDGVAGAARRGTERVESLAADLSVMASQVASSGAFLRELAERMDEIERTAAAIRDVSEDLSVISINTAIEAARAGDKGRGFAVIAREVRTLADRSGELSDSIVKRLGEAGAKLGGVRAAVGSAEASSRSAADSSKEFAREFSAIADASSKSRADAARFAGLAAERLAAEREIGEKAVLVAEASKLIGERGRGAGELAQALRSSTERALSTIAGARSSTHQRALAEAERLALALASVDLADRAGLDKALSAAFGGKAPFELLYALDASGRQLSSNVVNPSCAGKISSSGYGADRSGKEYYREPARTRRPYTSAAYLSSASGSLCVTAAVPLLDGKGDLRGVLAADLDASGLSEASCAD